MEKRQRYVPNLIGDMAECDVNYIRLLRLFPNMHEQDQLSFGVDNLHHSAAPQADVSTDEAPEATVTIEIAERCRYTTMLKVRVEAAAEWRDQPEWLNFPYLEIRIYHDTKSAEVTSFQRQGDFKFRHMAQSQHQNSERNTQLYHSDEKSQINIFLGELLCHCFDHGHSLERFSETALSGSDKPALIDSDKSS